MTELLLITPVLRVSNLQYLAKNIIETFKDNTDIHPVWVLCFDMYNSKLTALDLKKLEVVLLENNLEYYVYYQGKPDQQNYGGVLMNAPLQDLKKHRYNNSNPLVMVLDDDNILHKRLPSVIKKYLVDNDKSLWMNMLDEYGAQRFSRYADRLAFLPGTGKNKGFRIIHRCATCDPSQLIVRLDRLLSVGGFASEKLYDFRFMDCIYRNAGDLDATMIYEGTSPWIPNENFFISCYHNGLVTPDKIDKAIENVEKNEDSYLRVHAGDVNMVISLDNDELKEILENHKKKIEQKL